jgi:Transport protein particle (TRAPP) component.
MFRKQISNSKKCIDKKINCKRNRGFRMGTKLVEEFLAKSNVEACNSFRETAETIAKESIEIVTANKIFRVRLKCFSGFNVT